MANKMKTLKFTLPGPKPRNPIAVSARMRKAGPHNVRRSRSAEKREWEQEWLSR